MSDISKISSGGVVHNVMDETAREDNLILFQQQNLLYKGRDLTKVFATEIANFTDEWAWIRNRIKNANYKGIYNGDYIPVTVNGEVMEPQVAGIDCYHKTTDQSVPHHIDFISRDCFSQTVKWNETNDNNGNETSPYPYMVSNLYKFLNETLYGYLPDKLKNQIANKRSLLEQRYSASGKLTDSTSWGWQDMGKLWVPHEFEVFGSIVWGTKGWSEGQAMQYPIFANSYLNRIKGAGNGGGRCHWWLASVRSGISTYACGVACSGLAHCWYASGEIRVPLCFRITA